MRTYLRPLTMVQDLIALLSQAAVIAIGVNAIGFVLYAKWRRRRDGGGLAKCHRFYERLKRLVTRCTAVHFGVCVFGALSGIGLFLYELNHQNQFEVSTHDFYFYFWLGGFLLNFNAISSTTIFFLALERCLTLTHNSWSADETRNRRYNERLAVASVCVTLFAYIGCGVTLFVELPLQEDKIQHCFNYACMLLRLRALPQVFTKTYFSCVNLFMGLYFYALVRRCSDFKDPNNLVVGVLLLLEFVFSSVPSVCFIILNMETGEPSGNLVGPLMSTFISLEMLISITFYIYVLIRNPWPPDRIS